METKPVLRVGIISDVQAYAYSQDWGMHNCEKAFQMLSEMEPKIDVLMDGGDISDHGNDIRTLEYYLKMRAKYFGKNEPVEISCAGNHDFWNNKEINPWSQEEIYAAFRTAFGESVVDPIRKTIAGYDFIAFSADSRHDWKTLPDVYENLLRPELEAAVKRDPTKPIFLISHFQPQDTCSGSIHSGRAGLRKVLNDFPQVVSFSSHTHCPLEDERCIWQGEFTALNTSTLSYGCIEERCDNVCGPILPFGREVIQMMVMDVFPDRLEIHRYNVEDKREIKPDKLWKIDLPYLPSNPVYSFERRAAMRKAPEFSPDTKIYFRIDYGYVYLVFDAAQHDDFTHFYRITAEELDQTGNTVKTFNFRYVGNFFRLKRNQDHRFVFRMPPNTLEKGKTYRYSIYPVETFGKEGKPITLVAPVPPTYTFQNKEEIGPQE